MTASKDKDALLGLLKSKKLEPYIRYIRFPQYKNLAADTRVDFTYPISALVGANGTNKSSILRALYGAPGYNNLGNYWFSTSTDPITDGFGSELLYLRTLECCDTTSSRGLEDPGVQGRRSRLLGAFSTHNSLRDGPHAPGRSRGTNGRW